MDDLYDFLAQAFGPVVQVVFSYFILFLGAWWICAAAFWIERKLIRIEHRALWMAPFPILAAGFLYGGLRFSGQLRYLTDGWDQWGYWNYTNQSGGACVLFICGCLLIGAVLSVCKEKHYRKMGE